MSEAESMGPARREFLTTSALLAGGALVFGDWTPAQAASLPTRRMGRTKIDATVLSFGAIQLTAQNRGASVLERAIKQGVNLVHVSPDYTGGQALAQVGEVMKRHRDSVFLALKCHPDENTVLSAMRKLNVSYVDILIPNVGGGQLSDGNLYRRFESLQNKKKIGAIGFATHKNMAADIKAATAAGWWDCVLTSYNTGCKGEVAPVMASAVSSQKMGFMAMKASQGIGGDFAAGLRGLLANRNLATITLGMASVDQVDRNIAALASRGASIAEPSDRHYVDSCAGRVCSMCGRCEQACQRGVAVGEYLRAWNYRDRGDIALATDLVRAIPQRQSLAMCNRCGRCDHSCQRQLSVMDRIHDVAGA